MSLESERESVEVSKTRGKIWRMRTFLLFHRTNHVTYVPSTHSKFSHELFELCQLSKRFSYACGRLEVNSGK